MMMHRVLTLVSGLSLFAGCALSDDTDKVEPTKGEVDESEPPGDPTQPQGIGKADAAGHQIPFVLESSHPYTNNLNKTYALDLATVVPSCATTVRVHFAMLRTETNYDFVSVLNGNGTVAGTKVSGNKDNTWSAWATLSATKKMSVKLTSDSLGRSRRLPRSTRSSGTAR